MYKEHQAAVVPCAFHFIFLFLSILYFLSFSNPFPFLDASRQQSFWR